VTSWPALDVAIGLIFVYFLLSLFASNISEILATWFKLRARDLEKWLATVLVDDRKDLEARKSHLGQAVTGLEAEIAADPGDSALAVKLKTAKTSLADVEKRLGALDDADALKEQREAALTAFFGHPVVRASERKEGKRPSYVAAKAFSAVVTAAPALADIGDLHTSFESAIGNLPSDYLRRVALSLCDEATDKAVDVRKKLEAWYDSSMKRVGGWYKRRAQLMLFFIGLALAVLFNVDTIQITRTLWTDATVRAAVVAAASDVADSGQPKDSTEVAKAIQGLSATNLPLGWGVYEVAGPGSFALKVLGWAITALAVMLGAPFWFDLLSRFSNVRFTGAKPKKSAADSGSG
jgi:hypothetical protein